MSEKPSYVEAAINDWKNELISCGRLYEIFRVNFSEAYYKMLEEHEATGQWFDMPAERIEELLNSCSIQILRYSVR